MATNPLAKASFRLAAAKLEQLPTDSGVEIAFAGRSNAGKSSALNVLTGIHGLARVSKTPGRTQQLVVFDLADNARLIDLPGYGYAKVPPSLRAHWGQLLSRYFAERQSLKAALVFMDIRHPLTPHDQQMLALCQLQRIPVGLILTKADKLSRGAGLKVRDQVAKELRGSASEIELLLFSALARTGVDEVRRFVGNQLFATSKSAAKTDKTQMMIES